MNSYIDEVNDYQENVTFDKLCMNAKDQCLNK
jgi:hypothetical protein